MDTMLATTDSCDGFDTTVRQVWLGDQKEPGKDAVTAEEDTEGDVDLDDEDEDEEDDEPAPR